jgi:hypothetical protein
MQCQAFALSALQSFGTLGSIGVIGFCAHALHETSWRSSISAQNSRPLLVLRADRVWGGDGWILTRGGKLGKKRLPMPGADAARSRIRNGQLPAFERKQTTGVVPRVPTDAGSTAGSSSSAAEKPPKTASAQSVQTHDRASTGNGAASTTSATASAKASVTEPEAGASTKKAVGAGTAPSPFSLFRNHRPTRLPGPPRSFDRNAFP